ncbi:MAG TPA: hypothetical protein VMU71_09860 [Terracidiphilus sp.]|nr:hypothetical protein [Terracidiphilus sp.]
MAMYVPALDDTEKRVLRTIQSVGVAPGWRLMSEAAISADQLSKTAGELLSKQLITVTGNVSNPKEIGQSFFTLVPSSSDVLQYVL